MITHERLLELVSYDPDTGEFRWLKPTSIRVRKGDRAGTAMVNGYRNISLDNRHYYEHRLAWFYVNKSWPSQQIDHINGDRRDNRIANLREASHAQNARNSRSPASNKSGYKGVSWSKTMGKWWAQISHERVHYNLGYFDCPKQAAEAYTSAANRLHGDFANFRRGA